MAKKVLLCEDSSFFAQAISMLLKSKGYEVQHAADGQLGLNLLHEQTDFDLILCDIMMPNVDGYEVARQVQADEGLRKIPFIFLTGVSDSSSMDRANDLGATDYFIKANVGMDKITELVAKHIGAAD